ncbi:hypothetical protein GMORB2_3485 [Geosmithia morbida]|uniref:DUF7357 domain-containing protein n=1 Tax=Geosmithia morbida TaxID=1094350 RepID=A0A9P4YSA6_9HYPO|nr:uncharacterized protein GMORB2_3485 [Geosmithia morbida]KAF4120074.1 hypothetical protein GMORB2_3485 [Geosmithia morbida]
MSSNGIRLRLTIRRHALPDVKFVWPCVTSHGMTIANLLSEVNNVVTLESGQWGLEDYAVELSDGQGGSFECLHFQQVAQVFKNDDQVLIRSLLVEDLRRRRISGRHQISNDGVHLVDGVPFGRNRMPRNRPTFSLPPRKRARITYDPTDEDDDGEDYDEDGDDEMDEPVQLLLDDSRRRTSNTERPSTTNFGTLHNDDDDEDYEYVPGDALDDDADNEGDSGHVEEGEKEELDEEIRLLQADSDIVGGSDWEREHRAIDKKEDHDDSPSHGTSQPLLREIPPAAISALQAAFPLTSATIIEATLQRHKASIYQSYSELAATNDPVSTFEEVLDAFFTARFQPNTSDENSGLLPEIEQDTGGGVGIQEVTEVSSTSDSESESSDAHDESHDDDGAAPKPDNTSSASDESMSDSDDSDSDFSESDASKSAPKQDQTEPPPQLDEQATSESDSDSDSDSEFDSDSNAGSGDSPKSSDSDNNSDSSSDDDSSDDSDSQSQPEVASSKSADNTKSNSKPAEKSTKISQEQPAQSKGDVQAQQKTVAPGQGLSRTQKRNARRKIAKRLRGAQTAGGINAPAQPQKLQSQLDLETLQQDLLARKQALLDAMVDTSSNDQYESANEEKTSDEPAVEEQSTPRLRVDMDAGRRLLLGALGFSNPKKKADEEKIKKDLIKDVRPVKNHRQEETSAPEPLVNGQDDESWRSKITYRAVECCRDGMCLSEPPFPFVQRWDPQQQYNAMRKRTRGSQNHHRDTSHYEDESYMEVEVSKNNKKKNKARHQDVPPKKSIDNMELNYEDVPMSAQEGDKGESSDSEDDLPPLPSDISTLPLLEESQVQPGMVVLSITGLVVAMNDNKELHLVLAKRDREEDQKVYDEQTGQRIYDKFEVPDDSDEEGEDDEETRNGHIYVPWAEMMDARILAPAARLPENIGAERVPEEETPEDMETNENSPAQSHNDGASGSSLIPSGQQVAHLDMSEVSVGKPSDSQTSRAVTSQVQSANSSEVVIKDSQPQSAGGVDEATDGAMVQDSVSEADGPGENTAIQDSAPAPTAANAAMEVEDEVIPDGGNTAENQDAQMPTDISLYAKSTDDSVELGNETVIRNTHRSRPQATPREALDDEEGVLQLSSSPFPPLDKIWQKAHTQRQIKSPLRSSQTSDLQEKPKKAAVKSEKGGAARNLFPNATQPPVSSGNLESNSNKGRSVSTPFHIPQGSQVIAVNTSDDDDGSSSGSDSDPDSDKEDGTPLPGGPGWVHKTRSSGAAAAGVRRSSIPATWTPTTKKDEGSRPSLLSSGISSSVGKTGVDGRKRISKKF